HRHEYTITPKLPFARLAGGMPEAVVFRAWIGVESLSDAVGGELVFRIFCFLVKQQEKIAGKHAVEVVELDFLDFALRVRASDDALIVDVHVDPVFDVLEVTRIASSLVREVLTVEIERLGIAPRAEIFRGRITLHG